MTTTQLVASVATELHMSKKDVKAVILAAVETIKVGTVEDGEAYLDGFGKFKIKHREARNGTNPQTGEKMVIPEHDVVVFKAARKFKTAIE